MSDVTIGLVGDFDGSVPAHQSIPPSLELVAAELGVGVGYEWVPTPEISSSARLGAYAGIWCVPATPYRNMHGALMAIRWARENAVPFLGTCGGFQHAIVEYARNCLGWADADHAESNPQTLRAVISPLTCELVEVADEVQLYPDTRIARAYGAATISERYRCRYGLNPEFRQALLAGPMRASAFDREDEVRAIELDGHPFFLATLFQPERAALVGRLSPLVSAFVAACVQQHR